MYLLPCVKLPRFPIPIQPMNKKTLTASIWAIAPIFFIATTIIGAVRWFSPVPFWDMWDGYLLFYLSVTHGDWGQFFVQANEHRIVFSRLLFWLDIRYFHGLGLLLIPVNIALMAGSWLTLTAAARRLIGGGMGLATAAVIAAPCFSWMQSENIAWAYQSQFFAAYLFPLIAFTALARSFDSSRRGALFCVALFFGFASLGTMANGILALPSMVVMAVISRRARPLEIGILAGVTIAGTLAWLYHHTGTPVALPDVKVVVAFVLIFLGSPFAIALGNHWVGYIAGISLIMASAFFLYQWWRGADKNPTALALIVFLGYVCAASVGAMSGRAVGGVEAAVASRYTTPVLLAWATLLILSVSAFRNRSEARGVLLAVAAVVPLFLLGPQLKLFQPENVAQAQRRMYAALALDLGVHDDTAIMPVYPTDSDEMRRRIYAGAPKSVAANLSIFATPEMEHARRFIGQAPAVVGLRGCSGSVDLIEGVKTDSRYARIAGWAFDASTARVPQIVYFSRDGVIIGAALTGIERPDVSKAISPGAEKSGFEGYAKSGISKVEIFCEQP